jgi:Bacterial regulatory proteins, luxR family
VILRSSAAARAAIPNRPRLLKLIAQGLAKAQITKELCVSETTVKTHVAHVLMKLKLRDRVQAVVFAYASVGVVAPGDPLNWQLNRLPVPPGDVGIYVQVAERE